MLRDELAHAGLGEAPRLGHPGRLQGALAGEMCGSSPLAEAVTASTGTVASAGRPLAWR